MGGFSIMGEEKKIKIRLEKKEFKSFKQEKPLTSPSGNNYSKNLKSFEILEQTVKKIENKYKSFGFNDSKEEDFFEKNKGKLITLDLVNQEKVEGILDGVDKYRFCLIKEGKKVYYFKHGIISYYCS